MMRAPTLWPLPDWEGPVERVPADLWRRFLSVNPQAPRAMERFCVQWGFVPAPDDGYDGIEARALAPYARALHQRLTAIEAMIAPGAAIPATAQVALQQLRRDPERALARGGALPGWPVSGATRVSARYLTVVLVDQFLARPRWAPPLWPAPPYGAGWWLGPAWDPPSPADRARAARMRRRRGAP